MALGNQRVEPEATSRSNSHSKGANLPLDQKTPPILLIEKPSNERSSIRESITRVCSTSLVLTAPTLVDGLALLPGEIGLILLDLETDGQVGAEAIEQIQSIATGVPIIVLTGNDQAMLAKQCMQRGAHDYIANQGLDDHHLRRVVDYAWAQSQIQRLTQRLHHVERLASIGRLAAAVAHEVNNPAAFIHLNTEELLHRITELEGELSERGHALSPESLSAWLLEFRGILNENLDGIERVTRLIRDLKPLAKSETDQIESIDVMDVCRSTINIVAHHVRHLAQLSLRLAPGLRVRADARRLGQVITNLVLNAAQSIEGHRDHNEVLIASHREDDSVVISVRDTGSGIPAHRQARVFEPFYSTKSDKHNTGIGLSVSLEIIKSFGGELYFESTEGQGSKFSIRLPFSDGSDTVERGSTATEQSATIHRRVMLIDDDPSVRKAIGRTLARDHEVTEISSGEQALSMLAEDDRFDAILCDLMMPGFDGVALIEQLAAQSPELLKRVIILSGGAPTNRTANFVEKTDLPLLVKPVSTSDLNQAIEATIEAARV